MDKKWYYALAAAVAFGAGYWWSKRKSSEHYGSEVKVLSAAPAGSVKILKSDKRYPHDLSPGLDMTIDDAAVAPNGVLYLHMPNGWLAWGKV